MKSWFAVVSLGVVAGLAVSAVADDDHGGTTSGKRVFRAELVGLQRGAGGIDRRREGSFTPS